MICDIKSQEEDFMKSGALKNLTVATLTILMSHIPNVAMAETLIESADMISTSSVLADISREDAQADVRDYISKSEVQSELMKHGLSADEVDSRLASLSDQEIRQLAGQVSEARAGGDILVAILLVVLIIFLIKRI